MTERGQQPSGRQIGGGPETSDRQAPGGSSGTGGYGKIQDRMQGAEEQGADAALATHPDPGQSRGEVFDEAQGGGRDDQSISSTGWNEPQGEGGGLESQMFQHKRGGIEAEESERDEPVDELRS